MALELKEKENMHFSNRCKSLEAKVMEGRTAAAAVAGRAAVENDDDDDGNDAEPTDKTPLSNNCRKKAAVSWSAGCAGWSPTACIMPLAPFGCV